MKPRDLIRSVAVPFHAVAIAVAALEPLMAQQSASHKLEESVFHAGGHPEAGVILASAGFRITLDSLGDGLVRRGFGSASWRMDASFGFSYRPPGEVTNLRFASDDVTLLWDPERSVGTYNLYRALLSTLSGLGYGSCQQQAIGTHTTTDAAVPPAGSGYFYLVTAENRLAEEGTKGFRSSGTERTGTVCP